MANTNVKVNLHITFHVKNTRDPIGKKDLPALHAYIGGIIRGCGGVPLEIGGTESHVHILGTLPKNIALADYVRTIKVESSKWLKARGERYGTFAWQAGYGAFSVGEMQTDIVAQYIRNQEKHHGEE